MRFETTSTSYRSLNQRILRARSRVAIADTSLESVSFNIFASMILLLHRLHATVTNMNNNKAGAWSAIASGSTTAPPCAGPPTQNLQTQIICNRTSYQYAQKGRTILNALGSRLSQQTSDRRLDWYANRAEFGVDALTCIGLDQSEDQTQQHNIATNL